MPVLQELIDYYTNLLIIQYNNKPKARATIDAMGGALLANNIYFDVRDGYNLDTAVGKQLDVLGKYADIDRFYFDYRLTDDYFGFADAADIGGTSANIVGFDDAALPDKDGLFLDADVIISSQIVLNDDAFRTLIKLRIVQNNSNHSIKSIAESLFAVFGDEIIVKDNYDMTMTYLFADDVSAVLTAALQKGVLPRPAAVGLETISGQEFFGFADANNLDAMPTYLVGFNDATTGLVKNGKFLNTNTDIL